MYTIIFAYVQRSFPFLAKYWQTIALSLLVVVGATYAYLRGAQSVQRKWDLERAAVQLQIAQLEAAAAQTTIKTVIKYVDRIKTITTKGATIIKEVPVYVTKDDDERCGVIGPGFVELWNAANANALPATARDPHAPATPTGGVQAEGAPPPQ